MQEENKKSLNDKILDIVPNNIVWVFLGFILVVIILPRFLLNISILGYIPHDSKIEETSSIINNIEETSSIINNLTTPIIGLFSAFLIYIAFREQVIANRLLKKQNTHNSIDRYIKLIDNIKLDVQAFKIKTNSSVYDDNQTYLSGIKSIEHIFTLLNSSDFIKADLFLKEYYEDIIRTYLLSLRIIDDIQELDANINEKILLLNKLSFLKINNLTEIEISNNIISGTFGEDENKLKKFVKENLLKIICQFNDKYDKTYNSFINKLIIPLPKS